MFLFDNLHHRFVGNHDGNLCLVNCCLSLRFGKFASFSECDRFFGFLYQVSGVVNSSGSFAYHDMVVSSNSPSGYNIDHGGLDNGNHACLNGGGLNNRNHVCLDNRLNFDSVFEVVMVDVNDRVLDRFEMGNRILTPVLLSCGGNITTSGVVSSVDAQFLSSACHGFFVVFEVHCLDVLKILPVGGKFLHDGSALLLSVLGTSVDLAGNLKAIGGKFSLVVLANSASSVSSLSLMELGEVFGSDCLNNFSFSVTAELKAFVSCFVDRSLVVCYFLLDSLQDMLTFGHLDLSGGRDFEDVGVVSSFISSVDESELLSVSQRGGNGIFLV